MLGNCRIKWLALENRRERRRVHKCAVLLGAAQLRAGSHHGSLCHLRFQRRATCDSWFSFRRPIGVGFGGGPSHRLGYRQRLTLIFLQRSTRQRISDGPVYTPATFLFLLLWLLLETVEKLRIGEETESSGSKREQQRCRWFEVNPLSSCSPQ